MKTIKVDGAEILVGVATSAAAMSSVVTVDIVDNDDGHATCFDITPGEALKIAEALIKYARKLSD